MQLEFLTHADMHDSENLYKIHMSDGTATLSYNDIINSCKTQVSGAAATLPHRGEGISNYNQIIYNNQPSPQPSPTGEEVSNYKMLKQVQHDTNSSKRTYSPIHLFSYSPCKRCAFTLAEVLITLGIIGVVAAMTMPALIQNYTNSVAEARLKKFYSIMNQAILQSIVDNGEVESWSYFNAEVIDDEGNTVNQADKNDESFQKYLAPYLKITHKKEAKDHSGKKIFLYFLADGSAFSFSEHENRDIVFYPKNPEKCINKSNGTYDEIRGICSFAFEFYPINNSPDWKYLYKKGMEPTLYLWDGDEDTLYTNSIRGCNLGNGGTYCTAIIQRHGWKIPKNYPRRISF